MTTFRHLGEEFWDSASSSALDGNTVLKRIRSDLSQGLPSPITVPGVWQLARAHGVTMPLDPEHFEEGECARPLVSVAKLWGVLALGLSENAAAILGLFLADHAGGDAVLGGWSEGRIGRRLTDLLEQRATVDDLGPQETEAFLDELVAMLKKR